MHYDGIIVVNFSPSFFAAILSSTGLNLNQIIMGSCLVKFLKDIHHKNPGFKIQRVTRIGEFFRKLAYFILSLDYYS
jgi:hypothetical protein